MLVLNLGGASSRLPVVAGGRLPAAPRARDLCVGVRQTVVSATNVAELTAVKVAIILGRSLHGLSGDAWCPG